MRRIIMEDFLTVYRKDYVPKEVPKREKCVAWSEFEHPISESFRQYLKFKDQKLKPREEHEEEYMKKFKELYPNLATKYFSNPVSTPVIERSYSMNKHSVYQNDYCNMEREKERLRREAEDKRKGIKLPDDWVIPQATTAYTYRNPTILNQDALKTVSPIYPPKSSNISMSKDIQDILHITTGESEYEGVIGGLGRIITEDQIHGKIVHPNCTCAAHNLIS